MLKFEPTKLNSVKSCIIEFVIKLCIFSSCRVKEITKGYFADLRGKNIELVKIHFSANGGYSAI